MNERKKANLETRAEKLGKQRTALNYALYLVQKRQEQAADMVANVPNNIYIEEWKQEAERMGQYVERLEELAQDLAKGQSIIFLEIDKLEKQERI